MFATFQIGRFQLDLSRRRLTTSEGAVAIGSRAFDVLVVLAQARGRVVDKDELLLRVWRERVVEEANLAVQVNQLRRILGREAIVTVPGVGYQLIAAHNEEPQHQPDNPSFRPSGPPAQEATRLVGRESEVQRTCFALRPNKLVTLLGPGGVGKTRVALAVMREVSRGFVDGAIWVDATTAELGGIEAAITAAARLTLGSGPPAAALLKTLAPLKTLLVVDNAEVAVDALRWLFAELAIVAPGIRVLATSQVPLGCAHEQLLPIGGLVLPPADADWSRAIQAPAVQLLMDVVSRVNPEHPWREDECDEVVSLVRRLEGLPLAIEIVGSRIPQLGLGAFGELEPRRWARLRHRDATAPSRQTSLEAAFEWSCGVLSEGERSAVQVLSAFSGNFSIGLAEQLLHGLDIDPLSTLAALCDASLLQREAGSPTQFRLPDTVRWLANRALTASGESDAVYAQLLSLLTATAREAEHAFWFLPDRQWRQRYQHLAVDWQRAFDHACAHGNTGAAAAIGEAMLHSDFLAGQRFGAVRERGLKAFALIPITTGELAARLWNVAAAWSAAALPGLDRLQAAQARLRACQATGDRSQIVAALCRLAADAMQLGQGAVAASAFAALDFCDLDGLPPRLSVFVERVRADGAALDANHGLDRLRLSQLAEQANRFGFEQAAGMAQVGLIDIELLAGDLAEAQRLGRRTAQALREADQPLVLGLVLCNLATAQLLDCRDADAARSLAEALPMMRRAGQQASLGDHFAVLAARCGQIESAALLLGLSDAWYAAALRPRQSAEVRLCQAAEAIILPALGTSVHAKLRTRGTRLSESEALALVQAALSDHGAPAPER